MARNARRSRLTTFVLSAAMVALASAALSAGTTTTSTSTSIGCAPTSWRVLRVYVINEAGATPQTLDAAEAEAGAIWANAGLRLTWRFPTGPLDFTDNRTVLVIVRRGLSPPATGGADPKARARRPLGRVPFGEDGRPGNLIELSFETITSLVMRGSHLDRPVAELSDRTRMPLLGRGLGRVVAHEIGHWLMGRGHTPEGLMKRAFDVRDLLDSNVPRLPRAWTAASAGC